MVKLLKLREVAAQLNCSLSNAYSLIEAGELPVHRIGLKKGLRVSSADVEAFLAKVRQEGILDEGPLSHIR
jgi:excisionase family DNA binding protein